VGPDGLSLTVFEQEERTCDGLDNDADGLTDEDLVGALATLQDGVCAGALQVCGGGAGWVEPDYAAIDGYQRAESACDGLDNDCDGLVDEGGLRGDGGPWDQQWVAHCPGTFRMGSEAGAAPPEEQPAHDVHLDGFSLQRAEVSVGLYRRCVAAGDCTEPMAAPECPWGPDEDRSLPASCLTWDQAQRVCRWWGAELPTEAEWEYAARGGGLDREHPWGDEAPDCDRAVFAQGGEQGCGNGGPSVLCSLPAGAPPQGTCDLAGNVAEWVLDCWHPDYTDAPADGSAWTAGCAAGSGVLRGGSWLDDEQRLRAAAREAAELDRAITGAGVRCGQGAERPAWPLVLGAVRQAGPASGNALQVVNLGDAPVDPSPCELRVHPAGSVQMAARVPLGSSELPPSGTWVVCAPELDAAVGPGLCDRTAELPFDGDDTLVLSCGGHTVDVLGRLGEDPGQAWGEGGETRDHTLLRACALANNAGGQPGDSDPYDPFDPAAEWLALGGSPLDDLLGWHCRQAQIERDGDEEDWPADWWHPEANQEPEDGEVDGELRRLGARVVQGQLYVLVEGETKSNRDGLVCYVDTDPDSGQGYVPADLFDSGGDLDGALAAELTFDEQTFAGSVRVDYGFGATGHESSPEDGTGTDRAGWRRFVEAEAPGRVEGWVASRWGGRRMVLSKAPLASLFPGEGAFPASGSLLLFCRLVASNRDRWSQMDLPPQDTPAEVVSRVYSLQRPFNRLTVLPR